MDAYFAGIYKITFTCELCGENNVYFENFCQITLQPDTDINHYFKNDHKENKYITCNKCINQANQVLHTSFQEKPIF